MARQFLEMVRTLKEERITIMLSSHLLHQMQVICDRVGLFNAGRLVLQGTVHELAGRVLGSAYRIQIEANGPVMKIQDALRGISTTIQVHRLDGNLYEVESKDDIRAEAANAIVKAGGKLKGLAVEVQSLDDIYAGYFEEAKYAEANKISEKERRA